MKLEVLAALLALALCAGCGTTSNVEERVLPLDQKKASLFAGLTNAIQAQTDFCAELMALCDRYRSSEGKWPASYSELLAWARSSGTPTRLRDSSFEKISFVSKDPQSLVVEYSSKASGGVAASSGRIEMTMGEAASRKLSQ